MAITLELPDELEAKLRRLAAARGQMVEEYIIQLLTEWLTADRQSTLAAGPVPV